MPKRDQTGKGPVVFMGERLRVGALDTAQKKKKRKEGGGGGGGGSLVCGGFENYEKVEKGRSHMPITPSLPLYVICM